MLQQPRFDDRSGNLDVEKDTAAETAQLRKLMANVYDREAISLKGLTRPSKIDYSMRAVEIVEKLLMLKSDH